MIFLDAQAFIREAIDSVLGQTYRDFELILVDDGSTDESSAIARSYVARHPRQIRYVEHDKHENRGMSASRNLGVSFARGRLISFLDSDDIWLPTRLERYVAVIDAHPQAGMAYGPTLYWYSWDANAYRAAESPRDVPGWLAFPTETLIAPPEPLRRWLNQNGACVPGMNSLIIRREALAEVGGFEPAFQGLYEDQVFLSKMTAKHAVVVLPDVLDYYRQHAHSCCARGRQTGEYHPQHLHPAKRKYLLWLEAYCRTQRVTDSGVRKALRHALWPYRSRLYGFIFTTRLTAAELFKGLVRKILPRPARRALRRLRDFRRRGLAR